MKLQDDEYMKCHDYSVLACSLETPGVPGDGALGYLLWVYFEGRHLERLRMALKTIGLNLDEGIIERVDSKTSSLFEQELFLSKEPIFRWDEAVHSPSEEIRFKDYSFHPWADSGREKTGRNMSLTAAGSCCFSGSLCGWNPTQCQRTVGITWYNRLHTRGWRLWSHLA
ncbi:unnamed protein product [Cladocopium goreaui]|uniref:Uncharacterized protein n=1 Tax=Cladocopium goreaui TaxID=2562237 RepID=A0A9P1BQ84_9DINO|nr:unnamed protein product [Cladocopium goreaui]